MRTGRPLLFKTPEDLDAAVQKYINEAEQPTLAGLAYALGIDRQTLYNYKERPDFFDIIKKATDWVSQIYEQRLIYNQNPTGVIFALKNMGWKDQSEIKHDIPRAFINIDPLADDNSTDNSPKEDITS